MSRGPQDPELRRFRFRIRGHLGASTLHAFPEMDAETNGGDTLLTGALTDRAALYGVIAQIERLGLELLGIRRMPRGSADGAGAEG